MNNGVWNGFVVQSAIVTTHTGKPKIVIALLVKMKKNVWDGWMKSYETKCTDSQGQFLTSTATTLTLPPPSLRLVVVLLLLLLCTNLVLSAASMAEQ